MKRASQGIPTVDIGLSGTLNKYVTSAAVRVVDASSSAKDSDIGLQASLAMNF